MISLIDVSLLVSSLISTIGVAVIAFGAFRSLYTFIASVLRRSSIDVNGIRLRLGHDIILGLEFMVGADIIKSITRPTYYDVGLLALLVLIRTFLSYFLSKELASLSPDQKRKLQ